MLSPGIIPLPLSGTPPSHPFLRTVVLAFDGIDTSTPLGQLLSQSLNMIHSAPPDDQIVLALLILASSITQRIGETVDAWDGAKRALSYGRSMAYEDVPFLITAHSSIMLHPGMLELRTRAAIVSSTGDSVADHLSGTRRYIVMHGVYILTCREQSSHLARSEIWNSPSMITSTSNPMPIHEIFTAAMLPFTHLVLESQLLSLWRPVASALQEARLAAMMGSLDANPLTIAIDKFVQELAIWRLSLGQTSGELTWSNMSSFPLSILPAVPARHIIRHSTSRHIQSPVGKRAQNANTPRCRSVSDRRADLGESTNKPLPRGYRPIHHFWLDPPITELRAHGLLHAIRGHRTAIETPTGRSFAQTHTRRRVQVQGAFGGDTSTGRVGIIDARRTSCAERVG